MGHSNSALKVIRDQHKIIKGLLTQAEAVDKRAPEMTEGVVGELFMMVEILFRLEDEFLLPALGTAGDSQGNVLAEECGQRHAELRTLIRSVQRRGINDEFFQSGLSNFVTTCREHLDKEESETFAIAEKLLGEQLRKEDLLQNIENRRRELISDPQFADAQPQKVQNPNGGEQMRRRAG